MSVHGSQGETVAQASRLGTRLPNGRSNRRVLPINRGKRPSEKDLEGMLSSALLAADSELGQILHEVDVISKTLKSDTPDAESLRVAVHPAVWCAVRQLSSRNMSICFRRRQRSRPVGVDQSHDPGIPGQPE